MPTSRGAATSLPRGDVIVIDEPTGPETDTARMRIAEWFRACARERVGQPAVIIMGRLHEPDLYRGAIGGFDYLTIQPREEPVDG